jgi:ribosomal protein S14
MAALRRRCKKEVIVDSKQCQQCEQIKLVADFQRHWHSADGLRTRCKQCEADIHRKPDRESIKRENRRQAVIRYRYRRTFGLTLEEYDALLVQQNGRCAICGTNQSILRKKAARFAIDHDHATGRIRSLLCSNCNLGLGAFCDDVSKLKSAIRYLEKWEKDKTTGRFVPVK